MVTAWTNASSAMVGHQGGAGTVSVAAAITVSNLTFNAATSSNSVAAQYGNKRIVGFLDNWDSRLT